MTRLLCLVVGLVTGTIALVSCGSDGGGGGGGLCQQIGNAACTKACSCRDGAACAISQGAFTIDFDSEADCRGFFVTLGCSMGDSAAYNNAAACLPLVQSAMCATTGAEGALTFPTDTACESPE